MSSAIPIVGTYVYICMHNIDALVETQAYRRTITAWYHL